MKKYLVVAIPVLLILVLVLVKSLGTGHFRNNASRWAGSSVDRSNLITTEQLQSLSGSTLVVRFDGAKAGAGGAEILDIGTKMLLDKQYQRKLRSHEGNLVLVSDDPALSARMWMLLSQMGYRQLYILTDSVGGEVLKYKFLPDIE